jgi:hypothetical protein
VTTPRINQLLKRSGRSLLWAESTELSFKAVFTVVLALFAAVVLDAGLAFHRYGLVVMDGVLIAATAVAVWPLLLRVCRGRGADRRIAVTIERRLSIANNQLISAIDLVAQDTAEMSPSLRDEVIARGEETAKRVESLDIVDRDTLRRAGKPAAVAVAVVLLAYFIMPPVFHAAGFRLLAPFADYPPYTRLQFDIETEPNPIYFGKPGTIRVTIAGPTLPAQASIVFMDSGVKSAPLPMVQAYMATGEETVDTSERSQSAHFAFHVDRVEEARRYYIQTSQGRSGWYTLNVDTSPLIEHAQATYQFPDYTGWPSASAAVSSAGIHALVGTEVTLRVTSNVPLGGDELLIVLDDSGTASPTGTAPLVPDPVDPHVAAVTFRLDLDGRFVLSLVGADGKPGMETLEGKLRALPDRPPKIDIVFPDRQVVAPEGWEIDVDISAGDDIGIERVTIHHGQDDQPTAATSLAHRYVDAGKTLARAGHRFDLAKLGARAGDKVHYYAMVDDNRPGTSQTAETTVHVIHVISMQQYLDLARSKYRIDDLNHEFEAYLQRLDDIEAKRDQILTRIEELCGQMETDEPLSDEDRSEIEALESALNDYNEQASQLKDDLLERAEQATLYEFEAPYKKMLRQIGSQLQAQSDSAEKLASALRDLNETDKSAQRSAVNEQVEEFSLLKEPFSEESKQLAQRAEEDLDRLRLAEAMILQGERIRRVAMEQADLAVRMSGLGKQHALTADQQRRADKLAAEQSALRDELSDATEALRDAADEAGELLPNMSRGALAVVDKIDRLRIVSTQTAAEKAAMAGNGVMAHLAAKEASEKLNSLLSDVGQNQSQASGDLDSCFNLPRQQIQNALKQMAAGRGLPSMGAQGSTGAGMSGAMSRMSMAGPAMPGSTGSSEGGSQDQRGRGTQGGLGISGLNTDDSGGQAEYIQADDAARSTYGVTLPPGVPIEYREQAEAYFKRIAEENR